MTGDAMAQLREATASYHEQLENNGYARAMMNGTMNLEMYRQYVQLFYGFVKPLEERAVRSAGWESSGLEPMRLKTPQLEEDLRHLGLKETDLAEVPVCGNLPELDSSSRLLGCFYVMEGSTLGGQLITKELMKRLPLSPGAGISYFAGYGERTREMWKAFREKISRAESEGADLAAMREAAADTFRKLDEWIRLHPPEGNRP